MSKSIRTLPRLVSLKYLFAHPWHIVMLAAATVFGTANWSLAVLFWSFIVIEVVVHTIIYNLPMFVRYVNEQEGQKLEEQNARVRFAERQRIADEELQAELARQDWDTRFAEAQSSGYSRKVDW